MVAWVMALSFTYSCGSSEDSSQLHEQVMTFHDEVMPMMSNLYKAEKTVNQQIGALDSTASTAVADKLKSQSQTLKTAQDNMMSWMREFKVNYNDELTEQEKIKILKEELDKMKSLNVLIKEAEKVSQEVL